jgi:hypothetical protein
LTDPGSLDSLAGLLELSGIWLRPDIGGGPAGFPARLPPRWAAVNSLDKIKTTTVTDINKVNRFMDSSSQC